MVNLDLTKGDTEYLLTRIWEKTTLPPDKI